VQGRAFELEQVARHVEMKPVLRPEPRLPASEVRNFDHERAARTQQPECLGQNIVLQRLAEREQRQAGNDALIAAEAAKGLIRDNVTGGVKVVEVADVGEDAILVHDSRADDPTTAFAISRLTDAGYLYRAPIGIFRQVERPTYDDLARDQIDTAREQSPGETEDRLTALINGPDTWTVV